MFLFGEVEITVMNNSVMKKEVTYKGMKCRLYDTYLAEDDGPLVKICNSDRKSVV